MIWNKYLAKFDLPSSFFQYIPKDTDKFCVIVEPRNNPLLISVIKNFIFLLQTRGWGLIVFHGSKNETLLRDALAEWPNVIMYNMKVVNMEILDYNKLLMSGDFWRRLLDYGCKYAFIFQMDTILLNPNVESFLEYDYVGAPWDNKFCGIVSGNGGLSLRHVETMFTIAETCPANHGQLQFEDIFFSYWCKEKGYNVPSREIASQFSVETIFYETPCGMHKPTIEHELVETILEKSYIHVLNPLMIFSNSYHNPDK
jgi:hypothetical protein